MNTPTATDAVKRNLSDAGPPPQSAASAAGDALKGAAGSARAEEESAGSTDAALTAGLPGLPGFGPVISRAADTPGPAGACAHPGGSTGSGTHRRHRRRRFPLRDSAGPKAGQRERD